MDIHVQAYLCKMLPGNIQLSDRERLIDRIHFVCGDIAISNLVAGNGTWQGSDWLTSED